MKDLPRHLTRALGLNCGLLVCACSSSSTNTVPLPYWGDGGAGGGGGGIGWTDASVDAPTGPQSCPEAKYAPAAPVTYATGLSVWNVAAGDLNGDGKPDLVVGNTEDKSSGGDCTVGAYLNKGGGAFAAMAVSPYGPNAQPPQPGGLVLADFDGNGKLDLVGAGGGVQANPQFLPGNGDGSFGAAVAIPVRGVAADTVIPEGILVSDFNGDKKPDLLIANDIKFGILMNSGSAQFTEVDYLLTGYPGGFAAADLSGDGKPEVIVADVQHGKVVVFPNDGTGAFGGPPLAYPVQAGPDSGGRRVAAADFNGDGAIDVAVSNEGTTVTILENLGNTSLGNPAYYSVSNPFGATLVAADLNGDGKPDLALSEGYFGTMEIMMNTGNGMAGSVVFAAGKPAGGMVAADFNGTGILGLAVVNNLDTQTPPTYLAGTVSTLIGTCPQ